MPQRTPPRTVDRRRMAATERHLRRRRHRDDPHRPSSAPHPPATGAVRRPSAAWRSATARPTSRSTTCPSTSSRASSSSSSAHSGSGKSTAMKLLIKELEPTDGEIRVAGRDLQKIPRAARAVLPPQPRRDLPGLQAAAEPDGLRERRLRAAGHGRRPPRDPRQGAGHPAPDRACPPSCTTTPTSSPAASSSAWRSRARS